jgi:hypothetical protein
MILNGVMATSLMRNQSISDITQPKLAGKHIIHENSIPKCSDIADVRLLILSNILNGPLPNTIILDRPYATKQ